MLFDAKRHEALTHVPWNEGKAREVIGWIARETEQAFSPETCWPLHPNDGKHSAPDYSLYFGAPGVIWGLHYLEALGAVRLARNYAGHVEPLVALNRPRLRDPSEHASYLIGDTGIELLRHCLEPTPRAEQRLHDLIASNLEHPSRELMWGAPGTMLAASFLHERTGTATWAELFRASARKLRSQLHWSDEHQCHYWRQDLGGEDASYLDAVHGFAATASVLIRGRHLLDAKEWTEWEGCIVNTVTRTASREGSLANWRAWLHPMEWDKPLVQFCHGAPGFVVCLADMPDTSLDELLVAAGETTWHAGPLAKGSNLCHGTGGNGYAFLKLHRRTGETKWLERARAFAMHGIAQVEADAARYGQLRHSLWTGDPGFAIYLHDCIHTGADFPTLDVFYARASGQ